MWDANSTNVYTSGPVPAIQGYDNINAGTPGLLPMAAEWMKNPGMGYFPGQTMAGFTPMQKQAWGTGLGAANQIANMGNQWGSQFGSYLSNPGQFNPSMNWFDNPHLTSAIQSTADDMTTNFQRNVLPSINMGAIGRGQSGGSRHGIAQGLAMSDLNKQVGNMANQARMNAYETGKTSYLQDMQNQFGARKSAFGMLPQMMGAYSTSQMAPYMMQQGIGQQQQNYAQGLLSGAMDRWNYYRDLPQQKLGNYANWIAQMDKGGVTTQSQSPNWGAGLAGLSNAFLNMGGFNPYSYTPSTSGMGYDAGMYGGF